MSGFQEILGEKQIVEHLRNAVELNKVGHSYIFNGDKGSGKKSLANAFAMALQCENKGEKPCDNCRSCRQAENRNHPDIIRITHDKPNSIGVEEVREQIVGDIMVKPYNGPYKIYIVADAEKLTVQAQNALLKTIEEPPAYAVVILLSTNVAALLATIQSRCVTLNMKPVPDQMVKSYLMEHIQIPDYQADVCVAFAQGNIGKAIQLASSESFNEIKASALHLLTHIKTMEISEIVAAVKGVSEFKIDIQDYLDFMAIWYRDVLYFKATKDPNGLIFRDQVKLIADQTNKSSYEGIAVIIEGLQKARLRLSANVNFDLTMELLFLMIKEKL